MLQSFSGNYAKINQKLSLQCYKCKNKPNQQFILLLCDHVICSSCLNQFSANRQNGFNGIKCPCGVVTYFKDNSGYEIVRSRKVIRENRQYNENQAEQEQVNSEMENQSDAEYIPRKSRKGQRQQVMVNIHQKNMRKQRKSREGEFRPSAGIIQSKNTTSTKNISRINTQSYNNFNESCHETPDYFRDKFMLQKSKYPVASKNALNQNYEQQQKQLDAFNPVTLSHIPKKTEKKMQRVQRRSANNDQRHLSPRNTHFLPKYIQSESAIQQSIYQKQNVTPNPQISYNKSKIMKNNKAVTAKIIQSEYGSDSDQDNQPSLQKYKKNQSKKKKKAPQNQIAEQLKSQINYLQIQHRKLVQNLQRTYNRALNKINQDFSQLQSSLKDLCLQTIVLDRNQSHVDFSKIVKLRYEGFIAKNIQKLTDQIKKYAVKSANFPVIESTKNESNDKVIDLTSNTGRFRTQLPRFSSPQPYRSAYLQTQPASIYSHYRPNLDNQQYKSHLYNDHSYSHYKSKNNQSFCNHAPPPAYLTSQTPTAHKLQKKGITRKTNVIIQL